MKAKMLSFCQKEDRKMSQFSGAMTESKREFIFSQLPNVTFALFWEVLAMFSQMYICWSEFLYP